MEEQITKMIKQHFYKVDGTPENSAKEITEHFMKFMEWAITFYSTDGIGLCYFDDNTHDWHSVTIKFAYEYWINEVLNK